MALPRSTDPGPRSRPNKKRPATGSSSAPATSAVSPGVYTWLPLGLRVLRNVEQVVREEMDAIGSQELLFPALLPRSPSRRPAGGWSTATTSSGSRTARRLTTCSGRPTRRCSPSR